MLILSPGEKVNLISPTAKLGIDAKIEGSPQTEFLYRTINLLQPFDARRDSLNTQYNNIQKSTERDSLSPMVIAEFMKNDSLQKNLLLREFQKMPGTLAWMFLQDKFDMTTDFAFIDQMEKALYKSYSYIPFVEQYHKQIDVERKTAVGSLAPDIKLADPEGVERSLSSLRGKVVLIDFWASWCGPCRKENPNVVKAYAKYKEKGFEVFSVSLDKDRESWLKAIATDKLVWPNHVSDLKYWKSAGAAAYGVTAIPFTVLIDKEGKIVAKKLRGEELEKKLSELLH
ncbi:MAG: TlpA family protein disulfide reductase [Bacteroidales bacterium]|nr:TlpA family protein disulfide reductase [Bacteroidales bacterium]